MGDCNSFEVDIPTTAEKLTAAEMHIPYTIAEHVENGLLAKRRKIVLYSQADSGREPLSLATALFRPQTEGTICLNISESASSWIQQQQSTARLRVAVLHVDEEQACAQEILFTNSTPTIDAYFNGTVRFDAATAARDNQVKLWPLRTTGVQPPATCHMEEFIVDLQALGVIAPRNFTFSICTGGCYHPIPHQLTSDMPNNSLLRAFLIANKPQRPNLPHPCCTAHTFQSLHVLFFDKNGLPTIEYWKDIKPASCNCR